MVLLVLVPEKPLMERIKMRYILILLCILLTSCASLLGYNTEVPKPLSSSDIEATNKALETLKTIDPNLYLPPSTVPGAINPLPQPICDPKYSTKTVRPPVKYTNDLKRKLIKDPKYSLYKLSDLELDHRIPLECGGDPTSEKNLWLEPWHYNLNGYDVGAHTKDKLENTIHKLICTKKLSIKEAQELFMNNWIDAYKKYIGALPKYANKH